MDLSNDKKLKDYPEKEKTAYLAAVASMATPEDKASQEQEEFLADLCDEAGLFEDSKQKVLEEARSSSNNGFENYLDWLRGSDLKYSFVVDIISFAKADGEYSEEEKTKIQRTADKLGISIEQYNALQEYVDKAEKSQDQDTTHENFLDRSGLKQKFNQLDIPVKGLLTGLIGSMLISGHMGRRHRSGGILSRLMSSGHRRRGGISSLVRMLSGGSRYRRSGGLLKRLI